MPQLDEIKLFVGPPCLDIANSSLLLALPGSEWYSKTC